MLKILGWVGVIILSTSIGSYGISGLGGYPAQAEARPTQDEFTPARDSQTFQQDLDLTNNCVKAGGPKGECLCVTRVLKYELNLREYKIASQLYSHRTAASHSVVKLSLIQQGYKEEEIDRLSRYAGRLTQASNFQLRCEEAQAYFTAQT